VDGRLRSLVAKRSLYAFNCRGSSSKQTATLPQRPEAIRECASETLSSSLVGQALRLRSRTLAASCRRRRHGGLSAH
jgi:hypothetical protein